MKKMTLLLLALLFTFSASADSQRDSNLPAESQEKLIDSLVLSELTPTEAKIALLGGEEGGAVNYEISGIQCGMMNTRLITCSIKIDETETLEDGTKIESQYYIISQINGQNEVVEVTITGQAG